MKPFILRIVQRLPSICGNSASFASLIAAGGAAGVLGAAWPIILFVAACTGIASYQALTDIAARSSDDSLRKELLRLIQNSKEVELAIKKSAAGAALGTDMIAALESLKTEDLPLNAPVRPYLILYRLLVDKHAKIEDLVKELAVTYETSYQFLRRSQVTLVSNVKQLDRLLGCKLDELEGHVADVEEMVSCCYDEIGLISSDLIEIGKSVQCVGDAISRFSSPRLDLSIHAFEQNVDNIARFHYQFERTQLYGREVELSLLQRFLDPTGDSTDIQWWLWTGPGGSGKSRLAQEICCWARLNGFRAGFLRDDQSDAALGSWVIQQRTLVIVDYVAIRGKEIRKLIVSLSRNPQNTRAPVRFILLERKAAKNWDNWWNEFLGGSGDERIRIDRARYKKESNPYQLGPLADGALTCICKDILSEYGVQVRDQDQLITLIANADSSSRPLFAALVADAIGRHGGDLGKAIRWDVQSVADFILSIEFEERWRKDGLDEQHLNLLTLLTLTQGGPASDIQATLLAEPTLLPSEIDSSLFRRMTGFSPDDSSNGRLVGLEPDFFGELYVLRRMQGEFSLARDKSSSGKASERILQIAFCLNALATLSVLTRMRSDFSDLDAESMSDLGLMVQRLSFSKCLGIPSIISDDPVAARSARAEIAFGLGSADAALRDLSECLSRPDLELHVRASLLVNRGITYSGLENNAAALADYREVIEMSEATPDQKAQALVNRGTIFGELGRTEEKLGDYSRVVDMPGIEPATRAQALVNRGLACGKLDDIEGELRDLTAVIEMVESPHKQKAEAFIARGNAENNCGRTAHAMNDFTKALSLRDAPVSLKVASLECRARLYYQLSDFDAALEDCETILGLRGTARKEHVEALIFRGKVRLKTNEPRLAMKDFFSACEFPPADNEQLACALFWRAEAQLTLGRTKRSLKDCATAIKLGGISDATKTQILYRQARAFEELKDAKSEKATYDAILSLPDLLPNERAQTLTNRGAAFGLGGDLNKALRDYTAALDVPGASPEQTARALLNRGGTYSQLGKRKRALKDYSAAIRVKNAPKAVAEQVYINRAYLFIEKGEFKKALDDCKTLLTRTLSSETRVKVLFVRSRIFFSTKKKSLAVRDLKEILSLNAGPKPLIKIARETLWKLGER